MHGTAIFPKGVTSLGAVRFPSSSRNPALWARLPSNLSEAELKDLVTGTWRMQQPSVVISIVGSDTELNFLKPRDRLAIERGLIDVVKQTGAWLLTGGTDNGVSRMIGRMVREQWTQPQPIVCIGIAPSSRVRYSHDMASSSMGSVFKYPSASESVPSSSFKDHRLEASHTHFLILDTKKEVNPYYAEVEFHSRLEHVLCGSPGERSERSPSSSEIATPLVMVRARPGSATREWRDE